MIITSNPMRNTLPKLLKMAENEDIAVISINIQTTGLDYMSNSILQIGAIKYHMDSTGHLIELDCFNKYVKYEGEISDELSNLNGITIDMVKDAEPIDIVLRKFADFCGDKFVAMFYNAPFGVSWFKWYHVMLGIPFEPFDTLDVLRMVQDVYGAVGGSLKLQNVAEEICVETDGGYHDAIHDARCAGLVYNHFRTDFLKVIDVFPQGNEKPQIIRIEKLKNTENAPVWQVFCRFYGRVLMDSYSGTWSNEFDCFEKIDVNDLELQVLEYFNKGALRDIW